MRFVYFILLLILATELPAQHLRYKDIVPLLPDMRNQEIKNTLKEYLATDPDHPHANFRLALAYEKNYKTADVLTNPQFILANAQQAKIRFFKAKLVVDEKEVSRNNEYYFQTFRISDDKGKPAVTFSVVQKKILDGLDSADICLKKVPPIYRSFTKSVRLYDKAVKIFAAMNSNFLTLNDLLLNYNQDIEKQIKELQVNYDSAKFYFDQYLTLVGTYPIPGHHQNYRVKPIVTYRLDGLITSLNFLTDKIEFWDYASWAREIQRFVNQDILALRKRLMEEEEKIDQSLTRIDHSNGEGISPVKLDKQLAYNLNNFDHQSLALALIDYKAYKQQWMIRTKTFTADTTFSYRNAENYSSLIYFDRQADTLTQVIKDRLTSEKFRKHTDFLDKYYGNLNGLQGYLSKEKTQIDNSYKTYGAQLENEVVGFIRPPQVKADENKIIKSGKWNINNNPVEATPELLDKGDPLTLKKIKTIDGGFYLTGIYKADKKTAPISSFLMRVGPDGKAAWIKNFENKIDSLSKGPDASNFIAAIELTKEGCALALQTIGTSTNSKLNTFIYFNDKGEVKLKVKLKDTSYPRQLSYIEKSNSFVLVLKGNEEKNNSGVNDPITVIGLNILGDLLWKRLIDVTGSFTELVNLTNGNMLVGNFMTLKDHTNKERRTKAALESNPFLATINNQGDITRILPITLPQSVRIFKVVKVNDSCINLIGRRETLDSPDVKTILPDEKLVHLMVNQDGRVIYSNL
jgi:hypothetical protein